MKIKRPAELWERFSQAAGCGVFSRPVRFLVLLNGDMIALMEELQGGSWCIFATERANGKITKTPVYKMRSVAEVMFREIATEITEKDKDTLAARATAVPYEQANPEQKRHITKAVFEYLRLRTADEDEFEGSMALAERLSEEDAQHYIRDAESAYAREKAQDEIAE